MTEDLAAELRRCPEVLAELTARVRTKEIFKFPPLTPQRGPTSPWPPDDYVHLGSDKIPMELAKSVPKAAYWTKKRAAIYREDEQHERAL